jgi:hypothetical protein
MKRFAAFALVFVLAGCGGNSGSTSSGTTTHAAPTPSSGAPPWPAPPNPMELTRKAGLVPETHEFLKYHVHSHLDVFVNGTPVVVPAGIGIDIDNPAVRSGTAPDGSPGYGNIDPPCAEPCISPLHTHLEDGILHTESKTSKPNRLGQFFIQWDVRLTPTCVGGFCKPTAPIAIYVDGDRYTGDPRAIGLENLREIAIVIGTPPESIPSEFPSG